MLSLFQDTAKGPIVKALVGDGGKQVRTEHRPPEAGDWQAHLQGREALGVLLDRAVSLDFDHHSPKDLGPLLEVFRALDLPAYYGPGTTRGSRVWFFLPEAGDWQGLAQGVARLARDLGLIPCEGYPNGAKPVILPLYGALNGNPRPLYRLDGAPVSLPFAPETVDPQALGRLVKAGELFHTALQRKPESRHDAAMTFLNLAHRLGVAKELAALLSTPRLYQAWGLDDGTRSLEAWKEEVQRLLGAAQDPGYDRKRGLPYLKDQGFELPRVLVEELEPWPEPQPLDQGVGLPAWPRGQGLVPDELEELATRLGDARAVDPTPIAVGGLAVLSAVLAHQGVIIQPDQDNAAWWEAPVLWVVLLGHSGSGKTPILRALTEPVRALEKEFSEENREASAQWEAELAAWKAAKPKERGPKPEPPPMRRLMVSDATPEALGQILAQNHGVLAVVDELKGLLYSWRREDRAEARALYLSAYSGQGLTVDRILRGTVYLERPMLALLGGIQPGPWYALLQDSQGLREGADGLLQRLTPVMVQAFPPHRNPPPVREEVLGNWRGLVEGLLDPDGVGRAITTSPQALPLWREWVYQSEVEARKEDLPEAWRSYLSKRPGLTIRIAAILAVARGNPTIATEDLEAAIALVQRVLEPHARAAWAIGENTIPEGAKRLAKRIQEKRLEEVGVRDLLTHRLARNKGEALEALYALERLGWLRPEGKVWRVNPKVLGGPDRPPTPTPSAPFSRFSSGGSQGGETPSGTLLKTAEGGIQQLSAASAGGDGDTPTAPVLNLLKTAEGGLQQLESSSHTQETMAQDPTAESAEGVQRVCVSQEGCEDSLNLSLVETAKDLADLLPQLMGAQAVGVDLETTGLDPHLSAIRLVSLALEDRAYVVDLFRLPQALEALRPLFEAKEGPILVGHNLRFDLGFLLQAGVWPRGERLRDTGLTQQILEAIPRMPALKDLVPGLDKALQASDWSGPLTQAQLSYAARDAHAVLNLYRSQRVKVLVKALHQVALAEMRALPAVAWMELMGVPFDLSLWLEAAREAETRVKELEAALPFGVNWRSPSQVLRYLRAEGLDLQDTREETLTLYRGHPVVDLLLEYKKAQKRLSAFGPDWAKYLHPSTGRIHPDWKQIGAETGRMACTRPNLQQVPRDPDLRGAFRAPEGRVLVKADFSQIELRLAAQIAGDGRMLEAYAKGEDLHTLTASLITGKEAITKEDRQLAKALNFGLLYGMGAESLREYARTSYGVELTPEEAQAFRDRFFQAYAGLKTWHLRTGEALKASGEIEVRTLLGRRRKTNRFTEALNTPVQGSGADGLKLALALLYERRAEAPGCFPILAVHDEIVVEAPEDRAQEALAWLTGAMRDGMGQVLTQVPVEVEAGVYRDWGATPKE